MDILASPASLGGLVSLVVLGAWAVGRWQGGAAFAQWHERQVAPDVPGQIPPDCLQLGGANRSQAPESAISLSQLHDEISAFRRQEQIFAAVTPDALILDCLPHFSDVERVSASLPAPAVAERTSGLAHGRGGSFTEVWNPACEALPRAPQPSLDWLSFTRV